LRDTEPNRYGGLFANFGAATTATLAARQITALAPVGKELAQVRDPLYESLADLVFQSQNRSLAASADLLVKAIQSYRTTNREQQNPHDRLIE
jgi:hypothetical protein